MNIHSETDRIALLFSCTHKAVQTGFPHLAVRDIIDPPHTWFDAALARQIVMHILNVQFSVPRRRIVFIQGRERSRLTGALRKVDERLQDACFRAAYRRMARLARELVNHELERAAA